MKTKEIIEQCNHRLRVRNYEIAMSANSNKLSYHGLEQDSYEDILRGLERDVDGLKSRIDLERGAGDENGVKNFETILQGVYSRQQVFGEKLNKAIANSVKAQAQSETLLTDFMEYMRNRA